MGTTTLARRNRVRLSRDELPVAQGNNLLARDSQGKFASVDHDAGNLSNRFVPEIRNPRIVHCVSAGHGEGLHQRDVASRVVDCHRHMPQNKQPFSRDIGVTPKNF